MEKEERQRRLKTIQEKLAEAGFDLDIENIKNALRILHRSKKMSHAELLELAEKYEGSASEEELYEATQLLLYAKSLTL
jgi:hypothetical protein